MARPPASAPRSVPRAVSDERRGQGAVGCEAREPSTVLSTTVLGQPELTPSFNVDTNPPPSMSVGGIADSPDTAPPSVEARESISVAGSGGGLGSFSVVAPPGNGNGSARGAVDALSDS